MMLGESVRQLSGAGNREKIILVIDDRTRISRLMEIMLMDCFDKYFNAIDINTIDTILQSYNVTHLLCDYNTNKPYDAEAAQRHALIRKWRRNCPSIERTVVCSETLPSRLGTPKEVDAVVLKGDPPGKTIESLLGFDPHVGAINYHKSHTFTSYRRLARRRTLLGSHFAPKAAMPILPENHHTSDSNERDSFVS